MQSVNARTSEGRNERRRSPRHRVARAATIRCGREEHREPCVVLDISEGGARIHLHSHPREIECIELCMDCINFTAECHLVWWKSDEIGVKFVRIRQ